MNQQVDDEDNYEQADMYDEHDMEVDYQEDNNDPISTEDVWIVISKYFEKRGLLSQQIDSFNTFVDFTLCEVLNSTDPIKLKMLERNSSAQRQECVFPGCENPLESHNRNGFCEECREKKVLVQLSDGKMQKPTYSYSGDPLYPQSARLRGYTYAFNFYVSVSHQFEIYQNGELYETTDLTVDNEQLQIARIPMMVKSDNCHLSGKNIEDLYAFGECTYDSGGYFIINGSEKVIVAQEKAAPNKVQIFHKKADTKYGYYAEVRSQHDINEEPLPFSIFLANSKSKSKANIDVDIPYVLEKIPLFVLFKALGVESDRTIIGSIVYDFNDSQMMELIKPSLEKGKSISGEMQARAFIGARSQS
eukprot:CAMPEP_0117428474 /NCGR_PEP_ID=MMETSP0758-20121206/8171_1 /TAXON_ID=63605 /ORGANISM="Percolomonas cosmopolitus, Strain AE-1 (ATCC 50343)" /LENGTH=360 /DNA_ID=CAMNT_0005214845 /DNA_START=15 /DNA_END=1094 /DNA_ORIENTATION=-